jgi:aldose 1-epimerase
MTNHSYFNLSGNPENTILDEVLFVDADMFTPVDSTFMTTGEKLPVEGTPMDFTTPKKIGQDIDQVDFDQVLFARGDAAKVPADKGGYDHNWCLNTCGDESKVAVKLVDPRSGISLEVYTNEPGIQVYTGNFQDGSATGKKGIVYNRQCAICLETQKYPDSPNKSWTESNAYLKPGETYKSFCKFKFGVEK